MVNPIVQMSFLEDDLSSHINLTPEEVKRESLGEHWIPSRYDIDRFVILPVNPNLIYSYWFTRESLKEELKEKFGSFDVCIRLLVGNAVKRDIVVNTLEGEYYINYHAPFERVRAVLGILKDSEFSQILTSNEIVMPSDTIFVEEDQHWYNRKDGLVKVLKSEIDYIDEFNQIVKEKFGVSIKGYFSWRK